MDVIEQADSLRDELTVRITASHPRLLELYPLQCYIDYLDAYPEIASYSHISEDVVDYCAAINSAAGPDTLETYHKLLLVTLALRAQAQLATHNFPLDIASLCSDDFERIVRNIELDTEPPGFYVYPKFCKELALCTFRLIPAGPQKVCLHGLPRSYLITANPVRLLRVARLLMQLGGRAPVYEMHTDSRDLKALVQFTPDGWTQFYRRMAALLEENPAVRGVVGTGWFFDPQLQNVSPELTYLRTLVVANGGTLLRLGPSDVDGIQDAIRLSSTRNRLHLAGEYTPTTYLVVWPRSRLIAWARSNR